METFTSLREASPCPSARVTSHILWPHQIDPSSFTPSCALLIQQCLQPSWPEIFALRSICYFLYFLNLLFSFRFTVCNLQIAFFFITLFDVRCRGLLFSKRALHAQRDNFWWPCKNEMIHYLICTFYNKYIDIFLTRCWVEPALEIFSQVFFRT